MYSGQEVKEIESIRKEYGYWAANYRLHDHLNTKTSKSLLEKMQQYPVFFENEIETVQRILNSKKQA